VDKTINSSNFKKTEETDSNPFLPELIEEDTSTGFKITSIKSIPAVSFSAETPPSKDEPNITDIKIESHSQKVETNNLTSEATIIPKNNLTNPR